MSHRQTYLLLKYLLSIGFGLCLTANAAVLQTFADQNNIPNHTSGTSLGTFSLTGTPDIFMGYTFNWSSGSSTGSNKFVVLYFGSISAGVNYGLKSNLGPAASDFVIRYGNSSPIDYSDYQVSIPDSVRVVGRLQDTNDNGDYDTASLWINPTAGDLGTPDQTITGFAMSISPSPLGIRSVNLAVDDVINITDIVVSDDFASASAIPEPSAMTLLGLTGCLLMLRRKRRSINS